MERHGPRTPVSRLAPTRFEDGTFHENFAANPAPIIPNFRDVAKYNEYLNVWNSMS